MKQVFYFLCASLLAFSAHAIDTNNCPEQIEIQVRVERVFKTSIYSGLPGWKEAQATLLNTKSLDAELKLVAKKAESCIYKSFLGDTATLKTASFYDPELPTPVLEDQLTLNLKADQSTYVVFLPVKGYNRGSIETHSNPFSVKVKAKLYVPKTGKYANLDMGTVAVSAK